MSLIDVIPIGKQYKEKRDVLMYKAHITNVSEFKEELAQLRNQYIIIFDDGYYLPASKEEYFEFIKKLNGQVCNTAKTIELAYKEMEEL